jgi:YVTN family beta-propeller protein
VHPDGRRVFASGGGAAKLRVLDAGTNRFIADIDVGAGPSDMAFTADGTKLYVACSRSNDVSVIDTSTYKRIHSIPVGGHPSAIVIRDRPNLPRDSG